MATMIKGMTFAVILLLAMAALSADAMDVRVVRTLAAKNNFSLVLIIGDSSVDPGNNNRLPTINKSNFPPYGKDFIAGHPTGRFTNGRLATDFVAEALGYMGSIRGFLDPQLTKIDLLHGVSFASAASGYDDLTANLSNVLSLSKQLEYLKHYKLHLRQLVGAKKAEEIIKNALILVSLGTNDFLQNYFAEPIRSQQYSVAKYQDYLVSCMSSAIKEMHSLGARRVATVSVPPLGCMPLVMTLRDDTKCDVELNKVAFSLNLKLKTKLETLKTSLRIKTSFIDIYTVVLNVVQNPKPYGFTETSKGCCGTGTTEYGITCRGLSTCSDRTKYVYWDAVHFTENLYKIVADVALKTIFADMFS